MPGSSFYGGIYSSVDLWSTVLFYRTSSSPLDICPSPGESGKTTLFGGIRAKVQRYASFVRVYLVPGKGKDEPLNHSADKPLTIEPLSQR